MEFLEFHGLTDNEKSYELYSRYGGLPYLLNLPLEDETVNEYLKSVYSTIVFRDVVSRYKLRNTLFLEKLIQFLSENIGNLFSAKNISDYLKSQHADGFCKSNSKLYRIPKQRFSYSPGRKI